MAQRFFTVPRKGLGPNGGPPFVPDLPSGVTTYVGQMSDLTGDYLIAVPVMTPTLPSPALERFPGLDVAAAARSRRIVGDPNEWRAGP